MTLAPIDLLAGIIPARPAGFGRLHALAVDHACRRTGLPPDPLSIGHHQSVVDPFEAALVPERGEPAIDRLPGRQVRRHQPPGAACPHHVEDAVDDLAHRPGSGPPRRTRTRQKRLNDPPLLVGQIALVTSRLPAMLLSGGRGPHVESRSGVATLWNHNDLGHSTLSKRPLI